MKKLDYRFAGCAFVRPADRDAVDGHRSASGLSCGAFAGHRSRLAHHQCGGQVGQVCPARWFLPHGYVERGTYPMNLGRGMRGPPHGGYARRARGGYCPGGEAWSIRGAHRGVAAVLCPRAKGPVRLAASPERKLPLASCPEASCPEASRPAVWGCLCAHDGAGGDERKDSRTKPTSTATRFPTDAVHYLCCFQEIRWPDVQVEQS